MAERRPSLPPPNINSRPATASSLQLASSAASLHQPSSSVLHSPHPFTPQFPSDYQSQTHLGPAPGHFGNSSPSTTSPLYPGNTFVQSGGSASTVGYSASLEPSPFGNIRSTSGTHLPASPATVGDSSTTAFGLNPPYTAAGQLASYSASSSASLSTPNLPSTSRYVAERKRRLSSLASSPNRQPARRVTAGPSETSRESLVRRTSADQNPARLRLPNPSYNTSQSTTSVSRVGTTSFGGQNSSSRLNEQLDIHSGRLGSSGSINDVSFSASSTFRSEPQRTHSNYPHWTYPNPPPAVPGNMSSSAGTSVAGPATPATAVIDLTGDDSPRRQPSYRIDAAGSRDGTIRHPDEFVVPRWQADDEVSACPVCGRQFSWYFRKHHCRKCGRVVCGQCSPHRITIPKQFIVRQPTIDLTGEEDSPAPDDIWGGAEVRVCNPCVPDPNFAPLGHHSHLSQQQGPGSMLRWTPPYGSNMGTSGGSLGALHQRQSSTGNAPGSHAHNTYSGSYGYQPGSSSYEPGQQSRQSQQYPQYQFHNPSSVRDLWPPTAPPHPPTYFPPPPPSSYQPIAGPSQSPLAQQQTPNRQIPLSYALRPPSFGLFNWSSSDRTAASTPESDSSPSTPQRIMSPVARPRRNIAEEDECPVCGNELPPKDASGGTRARELHVEDCIRSRSYGASVPTGGIVEPGSSSGISGSPARNKTVGGGRMLPYKATEKDCNDDDGEQQECVICLVEFEVGDHMARLECLCKFHEVCIKSWWRAKGEGSCPTHQLHE